MNRWLTLFHRWAGVALSLIFFMWFVTGAVLHFVGFPALPTGEARAVAEPLDLARVAVSPAAALDAVPQADGLRLASVAGRPAYLAETPDGWVRVAADTGEILAPLSLAEALTVARRYGAAGVGDVTGPLDYDQWIVHQHFDSWRPLYRIRLQDAAGTDVYVSSRSGEAVQRTTTRERAWNWLGAVLHWIYVTPLRRSFAAWNQVVWWLSLVALASLAVGTWLGIIRYVDNRGAARRGRARRGISPFRGWMRWHHILGLGASLLLLTWMLSGWLSMDHGRLFSRGSATPAQSAVLRGVTLRDAARTISPMTWTAALARLSPATDIEFNALGGRPFLTAYGPGAGSARLVWLDHPAEVLSAVPQALATRAVERVWPGQVKPIEAGAPFDDLYRLAESAPAGAWAFDVANGSLRVYVDRHSGQFVAIMDESRRAYAWIYYALHTWQFPGLIEHPQWRTALVLGLLSLGLAATATGVVLSVKRLYREFQSPIESLS